MELEESTMHILIQCFMQKKAKVTWMKLDLLTWLLEVRDEHNNKCFFFIKSGYIDLYCS